MSKAAGVCSVNAQGGTTHTNNPLCANVVYVLHTWLQHTFVHASTLAAPSLTVNQRAFERCVRMALDHMYH